MNADKFLAFLQEEMEERLAEPWMSGDEATGWKQNFVHERIGNVLYVIHAPTDARFEIEVRDA